MSPGTHTLTMSDRSLPAAALAPVETAPGPVGLVDDSDAQRWNEFVRARPDAAPYNLYEWRNVVRRSLGRETFYLATRASHAPNARITGVLPLVRLKSVLFGDFLVSMPYFNYGGVLAESEAGSARLIEAGCDLARRLGVSHMELRHVANVAPSLPSRTDKVTLMLGLPGSAEQLWKALPAKVRSQVRRPEKAGATAQSGGVELLDDFYRVFAENMRDLGTPVYPKGFFRAILTAFPQATRLFVVGLRGRPVAGGLVIAHNGTLEIPWASSLRSANADSVNMMLYWKVLEYACEQRMQRFDFGRCTPDSGTFRFKRQWGAEPVQLHWHYWLRDGGTPPQLNHSNPKYRIAVAAWQRLPLFIANRVGPVLIRNLP